jgi:4-amino-4-deoxy-L-arabinose transferase-like glycosyltransferase
VWPLLLLTALAAVQRIDRMPLFEPDEGRNAEVAREMAASHGWVTPRFHGLPYLDKPALYFDAIVASYRLFGINEAAARLPSLLFAVGTVFATFLLGRALWDRATAGLAMVVLATAPLFFGFARIVIFDVPLACFVVLSWWAAERGRRGAAWGHPLAWVFMALAVLVKGPVGLLMGIVGHVAMALGQPGPRRLGRFFHPLHLALFAAVLAPWVATMEIRNPGFLHYVLLVETVERVTRPTFQRTGPLWYYAPVLLLGLFPWSLVALARLPAWLGKWRTWIAPSTERGVGLAALLIVTILSLSSSKLGGYVVPVVPLLALLFARAALGAEDHPMAWTVAPGVALLLLGIVQLAAASGHLPLARHLHQSPELESALDSLLLRAGAMTVVFGGVLVALRGRRAAAPWVVALYLPVVAFPAFGPLETFFEQISSRSLARAIVSAGGPDARVAALRCFPTGIDWYLERVIPVVTDDGHEITSTYVARNFDALRVQGAGLWTTSELAERSHDGGVDFLITKAGATPTEPAESLGVFHKYRLWRIPRASGAGMP